jgi:predicted alpha/beta-hydrolase family hydrolase
MGARVAAQLASDLPNIVVAAILFSYPLHPPGSPEKLRDEPLASLTLPLLFIRGTKDPFCTEKPWKEVLNKLKGGKVVVHSVEGGGHGLEASTGKKGKDSAREEVLSEVIHAVKEFSERVISSSKGKQRTMTVGIFHIKKQKRHLSTDPILSGTSPRKKPQRR